MFAIKIARLVVKAVIKSLTKEVNKAASKRVKLSALNSKESQTLADRLNTLKTMEDKLRERTRQSLVKRNAERQALEAKGLAGREAIEKLKKIGL